MLLFQFLNGPRIKGWNREMHVKCTYNGVQLSETEFRKTGYRRYQIKILFLSTTPWHRSKFKSFLKIQ
uniref:Uncharacterized protein n=1 Tax=Populus trichocarpa TaxID=3694 RepID=A0A2K1Y5H9_POPTR